MNRVWIELEKPRDAAHAEEICVLANRMIDRLCEPPEEGVERREFFWDEDDKRYCFGGQMGYMTLSDRGEWFNLDYFGRA
jgi:hypothetical protein